ncbi:cyclic lactone autoinducer peptide [Lysinibacillus sp. RS5]
MINFFCNFIRNIFLLFGDLGISQMCFGYLHEVAVPEELEKEEV